MTAATRRRAKTDAKQRGILDAAAEVFGAHGFTAATMADIDRYIDGTGDKAGELPRHLGFEANARAYLNAIWAYRRAARVLASTEVGPITDATVKWLARLTS
jgi:tetracycline repressor-like protein